MGKDGLLTYFLTTISKDSRCLSVFQEMEGKAMSKMRHMSAEASSETVERITAVPAPGD